MAKCSNFSEIEGKVSLKRRNLPKVLENMVQLSESPTYPGTHLSRVYCIYILFYFELLFEVLYFIRSADMILLSFLQD